MIKTKKKKAHTDLHKLFSSPLPFRIPCRVFSPFLLKKDPH